MRSLSDILQTKTSKLTVKELKKAISYYTAEANVRITEYRQGGFELNDKRYKKDIAEQRIEKKIESLKKRAGTESRTGEIGVGVKGKNKEQLRTQLSAIKNFVEKDYFTPKGLAHQAAVDEQRYKTFKERYGKLTREDYKTFIDVITDLRETVTGFKYENVEGTFGQAYVDTPDKKKFVDYVKEVLQEEDVLGNRVYRDKKEVFDEVKKRVDAAIKAEREKAEEEKSNARVHRRK